jgi:hypothetical protein
MSGHWRALSAFLMVCQRVAVMPWVYAADKYYLILLCQVILLKHYFAGTVPADYIQHLFDEPISFQVAPIFCSSLLCKLFAIPQARPNNINIWRICGCTVCYIGGIIREVSGCDEDVRAAGERQPMARSRLSRMLEWPLPWHLNTLLVVWSGGRRGHICGSSSLLIW